MSQRRRKYDDADMTAFKKALSNQSTNADELASVKNGLAVAMQDSITKMQRKYLVMYYIDGMSMVEIAEATGVHKSTVSRTLARGRERLRKSLRFCFRRISAENDACDDDAAALLGYMSSR